jgi:hypothetical protein
MQSPLDVNLRLHLMLVLQAEQSGKLQHGDLIPPSVSHSDKLMCINIEVEGGVELTNDLLVPVILVAHYICQLRLITSLLDGVEVFVPPGCHPFPIHPLGLHHRLLRDVHHRYQSAWKKDQKC